MLILSIIILLLAVSVSRKKYGTYINPICMFFSVNLISIILMYATSIIYSELSIKVCIMIMIMLLTYVLGTAAAQKKIVMGNIAFGGNNKITSFYRIRRLILIYGIVFDIFAFYYLYILNSSYGFSRIMADFSGLNLAIQTGEVSAGISSFFTPMGVSLSLMILYVLRNYNISLLYKVMLIIQYILCYIPCISPRRDMLFYMIIITLLFFLTQSPRKFQFKESTIKRLKNITIAIAVLLAIMWLLSFTQHILNKASGVEFYVFGVKAPEFLKDPINYVAGNYSYLEKLNQEGTLTFSSFLIATLRLPYRYFGNIFGLSIDTTTDFALGFISIGNGTNMPFNTAPILYYFIKEAGVAFGIMFFIFGFISEKAFFAVNKREAFGSVMMGLFQYCIIILSFRGYNLIYQSYLLILLYMWFAHKIIDVADNESVES